MLFLKIPIFDYFYYHYYHHVFCYFIEKRNFGIEFSCDSKSWSLPATVTFDAPEAASGFEPPLPQEENKEGLREDGVFDSEGKEVEEEGGGGGENDEEEE